MFFSHMLNVRMYGTQRGENKTPTEAKVSVTALPVINYALLLFITEQTTTSGLMILYKSLSRSFHL